MNKNFTFSRTLCGNKKRGKLIFHSLFCTILLLFSFITSKAQSGLINDDFSSGNTFNWAAATSGSTAMIQNGKYLVNFPPPSSGKYRADFRKNEEVTFHAGNYPIIAIKINKPPRCNFFFDTNLGSFNNLNNNGTKIETSTGNVYYWDLSSAKLGTTALSTTEPTTLSYFQFKIADIVLTQEEIDANKTNYEVSWVKSFSSVDALRAHINPSGPSDPPFAFSGSFTHPGLLHNLADMTRIKDLVARRVSRPYQSYQQLMASSKASASYTMKGPYSALTRDASLTIDGTAGGAVKNNVESDFMAAYYNAIMYQINGNEAHAQKAIQIIDAYAATTKSIIGLDKELNGLYGFILTNAAEIMRSTYPAWPADKIQQCQNMLQSVFYPIVGNFRPCAHGNWDIICMKALMAIAIFTDDIPMFNKTVNYYYYGEGNGSIKRYVLTDAGQLQESNRDQPHTMLALGSMAELAEMALKQGIDLYSANNNAILRGFEYTSQYNLGFEVPFQTSYDYCEKNYADYTPTAISANGRGQFRAVFEIAYNHYVYRKGLAMPQTMAVLGQMGPEGAPFGADNPGYGSLFFYLNGANDHPFPNTGLINDNFEESTDLWKAATAGSVATSENGQLKITTVLQANAKNRGDMQKNNSRLHPGLFPILAIKMKKPTSCNFTLDTNLGSFGNGANKWTGKVGEEIYYYDLSKTGFGAANTLLPPTEGTTLTSFQFKVADISSGETSYMVDWVKTVKSLAELMLLDPSAGLINDNFTLSTEGWATPTSGASILAESGQLKINLAKQSNGSYRGDIKKTAGASVFPSNYPIVAIKFKKPQTANITFDTNLGSFGNGSNKWTGKVGNDIYYYDLGKTGFGSNAPLTNLSTLTTFQFKVADINSGETSYQVDWIKTVKSVEELQTMIAPAYQNISFPGIDTKKVGDSDFQPATASSGLQISYSSSNENTATIVEGKIHIVGAGTTEITATQSGDSNYYPAEAVKRNLLVIKKDQSITFDALAQKTMSDTDFPPGAVTGSGLPITYSSSNENVATIINGLIHLIAAGTTEITASQSGNETYHPAQSVTQALTVNKEFYIDEDHDGVGSSNIVLLPLNIAPEGYSSSQTDCNDTDPKIQEAILYYVDSDKDGFGTQETAVLCSSVAPEGFATNNTDCDDQKLLYADKDGDGLGVGSPVACGVEDHSDCDDTNAVQLRALIADVYAINNDTDQKNTIYIGYGSASLNISATPSGGTAPYTYLWNTSQTEKNITISTAGTYNVTIIDAKSCLTTAFIDVKTLNVQCGNSNDKVMVCHNGQEICVSANAVQSHLDHGDKLGSCTSTSKEIKKEKIKTGNSTENSSVYPNPAINDVTVKVPAVFKGAKMELFTSLGIKVRSLVLTNNLQTISLEGLPSGIYLLHIKNGENYIIKNIIKK